MHSELKSLTEEIAVAIKAVGAECDITAKLRELGQSQNAKQQYAEYLAIVDEAYIDHKANTALESSLRRMRFVLPGRPSNV